MPIRRRKEIVLDPDALDVIANEHAIVSHSVGFRHTVLDSEGKLLAETGGDREEALEIQAENEGSTAYECQHTTIRFAGNTKQIS